MNLGDKIRTLRISNGLTQKKLAEELDITRQAVARWEQNLNMPSAAKLIELSKLFNVPLEELCSDTDGNCESGIRSRLLNVIIIICAYALLWLFFGFLESADFFFHSLMTNTWLWCNNNFIMWMFLSVSVFASACSFTYAARLTWLGLFIGIICSVIWDRLAWTGYANLYNGFVILLPIAFISVISGCIWEHKVGKANSSERNSSVKFASLCIYVVILSSVAMFNLSNQLMYISGANSGWKAGFDSGRTDCVQGGGYDYEIVLPPGDYDGQKLNGWRSYYQDGYEAGYNMGD